MDRLNVHPDRDPAHGIDVSTGSLGQGIAIAAGIAMADRAKSVWCVCTDGESAEGSFWEVLRIKEQQELDNLKIYVNCNSYGAYDKIDIDKLEKRIKSFCPDISVVRTNMDGYPSYLQGLEGHYHSLTQQEYEETTGYIKRMSILP